ncbi:hypothetical protein STFR1_10090 [Bacillus vallismortis]
MESHSKRDKITISFFYGVIDSVKRSTYIMLIYSEHNISVFQKTKTHRLGAVKESDQKRELRGGVTQPDTSLNSPGSGKAKRNR